MITECHDTKKCPGSGDKKLVAKMTHPTGEARHLQALRHSQVRRILTRARPVACLDTLPSGFSCRRFSCTLFYASFPHLPKNFRPRSLQVRSPGSNDPTSKNICHRAIATVLKGSTWDFRELIRASEPTNCLSRNFDFDDLRSGRFSAQAVRCKAMGKFQMLFIPILKKGSC